MEEKSELKEEPKNLRQGRRGERKRREGVEIAVKLQETAKHVFLGTDRYMRLDYGNQNTRAYYGYDLRLFTHDNCDRRVESIYTFLDSPSAHRCSTSPASLKGQ